MAALSQLQPLSLDQFKVVRLIATDMDGTLTQHGKFTPALLQVLTELAANGIQVLIVTGRSAGWVNGIVSYLPVVGAIAENGGLFYQASGGEELLVPIFDLVEHRQQLAEMFGGLQAEFPQIQESSDNRFRITDWTFDVQGLSLEDLQQMHDRCQSAGWDFTYSTVQCHIKPLHQEKAIGLSQVLNQYFPDLTPEQIVTVGDSPNDESLFAGDRFPLAVGVANVLHYVDRLAHKPAYVTQASEVAGFCELAQLILKAFHSSSRSG
ncbi:MAG: HAD family phosphatase [Cyanobacteria bacterium CRU_2_1]|nr:HAD family phosphatase [Cyanobacteria bacterium RU_5_0]NJR58797.1 HAD family phosphatase [Cyanobacteria bacterium CRU_2_1]